MFVHKRGGRRETVHFDKITSRIQKLCYGLNMEFIDPGLKTGMYHLRTKPAANAIQFTVDKTALRKKEQMNAITCSLKNKGECLMCSV